MTALAATKQKLIFMTLGSKGDLYPLLGIAVEFKKRGYPVMMLTSDDHQPLCTAEGVEFKSILTKQEHMDILNHPDIWKPLKGLKVYLTKSVAGSAERIFRAVEHEASQQPCVLVGNNIMIGGIVAHEKLKLPMVSIFLHPFSHNSMIDPAKDTPAKTLLMKLLGRTGRRLFIQHMRKGFNECLLSINDLRKKLDLPMVHDVLDGWRLSVPHLIDLWPNWYCPKKPDWPPRAVNTGFINYDGPLKTQDGWQDKLGIREFLSRAPIFFSMGSEMLQEYDRQVTLFSGACRRLNRPGLMVSAAIRGKGSVNVNDDFRVIESAPYAELFTQVSAIVTHGGIGTVARALGSGKPVFVAPMAFDQFDNGYHVKRLGVGDTKPYRSLTPQNLAKKLERLLDSAEIQSRCRAVQSQMKAADGLDQTCAYIESHLLGVSRA